jgi:hypothetical protein
MDRFFSPDSDVCGTGPGILLILKRPADWNRCVEHERHRCSRPSSRADRISSRGDLAGSLAKLEDTRQRSVDFFLASIHLRHDRRERSAVPGDDERLTALYVIQQLRQMGFGFGCLNFTHQTCKFSLCAAPSAEDLPNCFLVKIELGELVMEAK